MQWRVPCSNTVHSSKGAPSLETRRYKQAGPGLQSGPTSWLRGGSVVAGSFLRYEASCSRNRVRRPVCCRSGNGAGQQWTGLEPVRQTASVCRVTRRSPAVPGRREGPASRAVRSINEDSGRSTRRGQGARAASPARARGWSGGRTHSRQARRRESLRLTLMVSGQACSPAPAPRRGKSALRRLPDGPPSPGVIRSTAKISWAQS